MRKSQFPVRTSIAISKEMQATILAISEEQRVSIGEVMRTLISEALAEREHMVQEVEHESRK